MKKDRQSKIIELITDNIIDTQEDLQQALRNAGFEVTQATVSRDIKELRIIKALDEGGRYRYTVRDVKPSNSDIRYAEIFKNSALSIDYAMNDVVIKCHSGMASGACAALDQLFEGMCIGTLAGDDTVLAITRDEKTAKQLHELLQKLL